MQFENSLASRRRPSSPAPRFDGGNWTETENVYRKKANQLSAMKTGEQPMTFLAEESNCESPL